MQNSRLLQSGLTLAAALALISGASSAFAGGFTSGDLVVSRFGTGSAALTSAGTAIFLDEYKTTGASQSPVQSIALPTTTSGSNKLLVDSGTATSDGVLTLSTDGKFLALTGYNAAVGTAGVTGAAGGNRGVAVIGADGSVNTSTSLPQTSAFSGNNIRSAASDGTSLFLGGAGAGANGGIQQTTVGGTTSTQVESQTENVRVANLFNSGLYFSTGSSSGNAGIGIYQVNTGSLTATRIATSASPYDFYFSDRNTLFVADDSSSGGLLKFTKAANATTFSLVSTFNADGGLRGLTGNGTDLYAITSGTATQNSLVDFNLASGGFTTLATSGTNEIFRGVDFAPQPLGGSAAPEPGQVSILLMAAGGLGLAFLRRRKQMSLTANAA